jgi:hypothetical protein
MFWSAHEALLVVLAIDTRETYRFLNSAIDSSVTRKAFEAWLALSQSNSTNRRTDLVLHSSWRAASAMVLVSPFARARSSCAKRWNPSYDTSIPATVPSALPTMGNSLDNTARTMFALASTEPTCYSALALSSTPVGDIARAQDFLLHSQNPNGSWPVFPGDDQGGGWITSVAVMALRDVVSAIPARMGGFHWLVNCAGKESNWFWKWKFRTADRHVRFDPDKYGWPWLPDTVSWVVPTAFSILALRQLSCACGGLEQATARIDCGIQMLFDRACPGGGWNAGNGVVYGTALAPHADDTAIALLALNDRVQHPVVQSGVQCLERVAPTLSAPWSLAWAILALAAHGRPIASLSTSLAAFPDLSDTEDTSTLEV